MTDQPDTTAPADLLDYLIRNIALAAHNAAIRGREAGHGGASLTDTAVRAAFECAVGNGLITLTPEDQWPPFITVTPPYTQPSP